MIHFLHRPSGPLLAVLAVAAMPWAGGAALAAGDPDAGQTLAKTWCASCHVVSSTQAQGQSDVPSFAAIARDTASLSGEWVAFSLLSPHPLMPEVSLTRAQAGDLAAYLQGMKKAGH